MFEPSWTRIFVTSIVFFVLFVPVVYGVGLNADERTLVGEMIGKKFGKFFKRSGKV